MFSGKHEKKNTQKEKIMNLPNENEKKRNSLHKNHINYTPLHRPRIKRRKINYSTSDDDDYDYDDQLNWEKKRRITHNVLPYIEALKNI